MGFYKNEILKEAGAKSKAVKSLIKGSVNSIDDVIKHMNIAMGGNSMDKATKAVKNSLTSYGTGSIVVDGGLGLAKKIPGPKPKALKDAIASGADKSWIKSMKIADKKNYTRQPRFKENINDGVKSYLYKLNDADIAAGNFLSKKVPGTGNLFSDNIKIKFNNEAGEAVQHIPVNKLSAPLSKVSKKARPFLAAAGASSLFYPAEKESQEKGGGKLEQ